jgi:2-methylcitrate dehydratase PrpD
VGAEECSITQRLAEWVVGAHFGDLPEEAISRAKERLVDSLAVQFGGMRVSTGQNLAMWIQAQGGAPRSTVVGAGLKTTPSLAALANGTAGHALEYDDVGGAGGHPASPLTAGSLATAEHLWRSGRDALLAWMVGWEVIAHTNRLTQDGARNTLLSHGWFPQGFQYALGVAAVTSKLLDLNIEQTQMAIGNAAAAMGGQMKHRASDTKSFIAGNAAMHGVMAGELVASGFTANPEIIDGTDGIGALLGGRVPLPETVLGGLGEWDLLARRGTIKMYASCAAGHSAQDAMLRIRKRRPFEPKEVASIDIEQPGFLMESLPFHRPVTGLQGKYSLEYDVVAVALTGQAKISDYSDEAVQRPDAQFLMDRVRWTPTEMDLARPALVATVSVTFAGGETISETVEDFHGSAQNVPTRDDLEAKFAECTPDLTAGRRREILDRCWAFDELADVRELTRML